MKEFTDDELKALRETYVASMKDHDGYALINKNYEIVFGPTSMKTIMDVSRKVKEQYEKELKGDN